MEEPIVDVTNPCQPSPCGPNAACKEVSGSASCSCLPQYIGSPPNCRPECINNNECSHHLACIRSKCGNPCLGVCGSNSDCKVISHTPSCTCLTGYTGDPFTSCQLIPNVSPVENSNPCVPSPCGANSICRVQNNAGACSCLPEYIGNPYEGCRPQCVLNSDCPANKACVRNKCIDPCPGTCGSNSNCQVINHLPTCTCLPSFTGDPFQSCNPYKESKNSFDFCSNISDNINGCFS